MKLHNVTKKVLVSIFGEEVLPLLKGHKATLSLIKDGDFPEMDNMDMQAAVTGFDFQDGKGKVLAMFINPESIIEHMSPLEAADESTRKLLLRGFVVHELTHIKQSNDGRLTGEGERCFWEGKEVFAPAGMEEYMLAPWEVEAYAAQICYVEGCTYEEAVDRYLTRNNLNVKQAA